MNSLTCLSLSLSWFQEFQQQQGALLSSTDTLESSLLSSTTTNHVLAEENIVEKTLLAIQEKVNIFIFVCLYIRLCVSVGVL